MIKTNKRKAKLNDLPANEAIIATIKQLRLESDKSQADVAYLINKSRTWVAQVEYGGIDPIFFYHSFVKLYGKEKAIETYGEDWDLYTGERLALYYAYYRVNRKESCDVLGISYTALRYLIDHPEKYVTKYKEGIDKLFPDIRKDDLSHYHLIGNNSMCLIRNATALIFFNHNANYKHKDTEKDYEAIVDEAQIFINFHDKCDHLSPGSYDIPASRMSYKGIQD